MKAGFNDLVSVLLADSSLDQAEAEALATRLLFRDFEKAHPEDRERALAAYKAARDHLIPEDERDVA